MKEGIRVRQISEWVIEERARLLGYFRSQGLSQEAEDLFQDLAVVALRGNLEEAEKSRQWLYGIARNLVRRERRKGRQEPLTDEFAVGFSMEGQSLDHELRKVLLGLFGRVDPEMERAAALLYVSELSLTEVADIMAIPSNALSARFMRARQAILEGMTQSERTMLGDFGIKLDSHNRTQIWCPRCGVENLLVSPPDSVDRSEVCCPSCELFLAEGSRAVNFAGSPKISIGRFIRFARKNVESYRVSQFQKCCRCHRVGRMCFDVSKLELSFQCEYCDAAFIHGAWELALAHPKGEEFWRREGRIRESVVNSEHFQFESVRQPNRFVRFGIKEQQGLCLLEEGASSR